jgi:hypothetical protein
MPLMTPLRRWTYGDGKNPGFRGWWRRFFHCASQMGPTSARVVSRPQVGSIASESSDTKNEIRARSALRFALYATAKMATPSLS